MLKHKMNETPVKEKKPYQSPAVELICFENEDIITASGLQVVNDEGFEEYDWGIYNLD